MHQFKNIMLFGASGGIGQAIRCYIESQFSYDRLWIGSRTPLKSTEANTHPFVFSFDDEKTIEEAVKKACDHGPLDLVIVATGLLSNGAGITPEKNLRDLHLGQLEEYFRVNTIGPSLIAKYTIPKLNKTNRSVFAALSARVGSISDNRLGGWYGYRSSKAALNMMLKCSAIEAARRNKNAVIVGLHPGTVDTKLSKPFQGNVPDHQLFSPEKSAEYLMNVIISLKPDHTGKVFAWDGQEIDA
jgi:NAD(P)-dependent dehydrogenase (short-subunit alcohol dehydrogenase family)